MTPPPPPPPASARFPDAPPSGTAGWTPPPARNPESRPAAADAGAPGSTDVPSARPTAARPVRLETIRPARTDDVRTSSDAQSPPGAGADGPARPGVTRPARLENPHPSSAAAGAEVVRTPGARPSRPSRSDATRTAGPEGAAAPHTGGARPPGADSDGPARPGVTRPARLENPRPSSAAGGAEGVRTPGARPSRPSRSDATRTAGPDGARPPRADSDGPARPGVTRPARLDGARSTTAGTDRPGTAAPAGDPAPRTSATTPASGHTPRPDADRLFRPAPSTAPPAGTDGGQAPGEGSAWSPLPRGWAAAPAQAPRDALSSAVPGQGGVWSPATPVRHPDFDVPDGHEPEFDAPAARIPRPADPAPGGPTPDPSLSWSAPPPGGATRPVVTFAQPEGYGDTPPRAGRRRVRGRTLAAATCVVLGLGLIGGAATGSWLVGDAAGSGERGAYATAGDLWHNVPVDQLFPPTVDGQGAGPGGADRAWTRVAVAPDSGCAGALDPLLLQVLAPVGCARLLRATYVDATQSYVTTVGMVFTEADEAGMRALATRFDKEGLARRTDLMPRTYAAPDTVAAGFGDAQRASWTVSVLTDAPVVVYAVSGWADGRTVATPEPAARAAAPGATSAPAQAGLGNEAKGLADRVERGLRKTVAAPSEQPS
ncbi:hypothetical protein [Streptomyces sp. BK239]|uniref:hypothetical protein n=1 Tax=Streptomyces sp. BK239 TaxID=2512155 RepID=UPI00241562BE|nr:hypothetical protein [Streptomyces sp. BK239]